MISDLMLIITAITLVTGGLLTVSPIAAYALRGDEIGERTEDYLALAHVVGVILLVSTIGLGIVTILFSLAGI